MNPNMRMDFPPQSLKWRIPLYLTPPQPQREWVGLDEADLANCDTEEYGAARYWEAKLREKNGGGV
jgi:hypothetical protein